MSIFVLKSQGIEPMIIGDLGIKNDEGIYIEVEEDNIPKKYRIEKLGGSAVINDEYMRSNTFGITLGKYFKKIAEPLDWEPIQKEKFEMLEDSSIRYDWEKVLKILEQTDNNSVYIISFEPIGEGIFNLNAKRYLKEDEIEVQDHKFKEFEENFRGMYRFEIEIPFNSLTREQIQEIRSILNKRTIRVNLDTLKTIVDKYNLKIAKERYHYVFYSKERTGFVGNNSKGIDVFNKNIDEIMTFAEATEKWGLADSTLRKLVTTDKLVEGVDYRKSGKVWLITKDAIKRVYGEPKIK